MLPNEVDGYFLEKKAVNQKRVDEDHALVAQWQQAHQNGNLDPQLTHQALTRFKPTMTSALNKFTKGSLSAGSGLNTAAKTYTIEALKTFDPAKGATFNTHLTNTLRRLHRENSEHQSAYTPEGQAFYFGPIQRAHDELADELGRPPTFEEHEQRLNEMLPEHKRLEPGGLAPLLTLKNRRPILASNFDSTPNTFAHDLEAQNVSLARHDLNEPDKNIYDLIYQHNVTGTGDIAKRLGMSDPAVSRAKKRIEKTITQPTGQRNK
jgi:DNA-directed RNA polymerase specialized sigma subunit